MKIFKTIFIILIPIFITGCISIKNNNPQIRFLYKKLKSEKSNSDFFIKEDKKGNRTGELKSPLISGASIVGEVSISENDEIEFKINLIRFFSNWDNGWTQGECEAGGRIIFKNINGKINSAVLEPLEINEVKMSKIRYMDAYYRGEDGAKRFKQRLDRISETVKFLKTKNLKEFYGSPKLKTVYGESFQKETEPLLFPEIYGFKSLKEKGLLDKNFDLSDLDETDDISLADDMIFRKSYTKKVFPKILQEIRDSGSMWKDYEESLDIFFDLYNMDYFFKKIINGSEWIEKK